MKAPAPAHEKTTDAAGEKPLLSVRNLTKHFPITAGLFRRVVGAVRAVDEVSFDIAPGETLGLVGESGCGKTTTGRLILRLIERTAGTVRFNQEDREVDIMDLAGSELRAFRRHMQLIFQDPFSSLNPRMTVLNIIGEPLRAQGYSTREIHDRVRELTGEVSLKFDFLRRYPHAFSGGQRQRICIARALALRPRLVVCDEPVSALDVSVQAQILNLLHDLQQRHGLTYLFIAHDLSVVQHISHRVAVMYAGRLVEVAATDDLYHAPLHPYTMALMKSVPLADPHARGGEDVLSGEVADPSNLPPGCSFHPRCRYCEERCRVERPPLRDVGGGRLVACHLAEKFA
jgi:peptide/nickel transport system ATP-binding protein